jgi:hypothetical protein
MLWRVAEPGGARKFDVKCVDPDEAYDEKIWDSCGYVYNVQSWIAVYFMVMSAEGMLADDIDLEQQGCIGNFKHLKAGLWGDGMDGAGKVKCYGLTIRKDPAGAR